MRKLLALLFLCAAASLNFAARIDTVQVMSASMQKLIPNIVITPENYVQRQDKLPVLYLLHGAGGNFGQWLLMAPELTEYSDHYQVIIVCPDGGITSWYFDSPIDSKMKYETYVAKELTEYIDAHYRTRTESGARAISGLSMGGHGGLYLGIRHPDVFGACGSMSGGVDIRPFPKNWDIAKRLGSYEDHKDNWEKNTVINLVGQLEGRQTKVIFDCGVDDFFYEVNQKLHQEMLRRKIPHDYIERPGAHDGKYWNNAVKYQVLYFSEFFQRTEGAKKN